MGSNEFGLTLSLISIITLSRSARSRVILAAGVLRRGATVLLQLVVVVVAALLDYELVEGVVQAAAGESAVSSNWRGEAHRQQQDCTVSAYNSQSAGSV